MLEFIELLTDQKAFSAFEHFTHFKLKVTLYCQMKAIYLCSTCFDVLLVCVICIINFVTPCIRTPCIGIINFVTPMKMSEPMASSFPYEINSIITD